MTAKIIAYNEELRQEKKEGGAGGPEVSDFDLSHLPAKMAGMEYPEDFEGYSAQFHHFPPGLPLPMSQLSPGSRPCYPEDFTLVTPQMALPLALHRSSHSSGFCVPDQDLLTSASPSRGFPQHPQQALSQLQGSSVLSDMGQSFRQSLATRKSKDSPPGEAPSHSRPETDPSGDKGSEDSLSSREEEEAVQKMLDFLDL